VQHAHNSIKGIFGFSTPKRQKEENVFVLIYTFSTSYVVSKFLSDKRPVDEHEADTVSILLFIQHLPRHCSLKRDWPSHARQANTTLKTHKTLLPSPNKKEEHLQF
jgi:hypothetical protein